MKISAPTRQKLGTMLGDQPAAKELCDAIEVATAPAGELVRLESLIGGLSVRLYALEDDGVPVPEKESERGPISGLEPGREPNLEPGP